MKKMNLPNKLTVLRMIMVPIFVVVMMASNALWADLVGLFLFANNTDRRNVLLILCNADKLFLLVGVEFGNFNRNVHLANTVFNLDPKTSLKPVDNIRKHSVDFLAYQTQL